MWKSILLLITVASLAGADDLRRAGLMGLVLASKDPRQPPNAKSNPVVVQDVMAGSAAEEAGVRKGEILRAVEGNAVTSASQVTAKRRFAGDVVHLRLEKDEQVRNVEVTVKPRPWEKSPYADVSYDSVIVRDSRRRVIVTRPHREGRLPAVLIAGGLGCYSLDGTDRREGYGAVISALEQKGFVTMRVEKTGQGDSEGPACSDLSATPELEADGYLAGLRALKSYNFVNPRQVYIFAHSMGPIVASLAAVREHVAGFVAVETIGTSWFEYDLERSRLQESLSGEPMDVVDRNVRAYARCSFLFFMQKADPEMLEEEHCSGVLRPFGNVPYTYMQAIGDIDLARQWKQIDTPVLVVYGTSSPVTTARQNRYLADMINSFRPGRATYVEIPQMGHDLAWHESMSEYLNGQREAHRFHQGLLDAILPWLEQRAGHAG